jgi:hypothetical protein
MSFSTSNRDDDLPVAATLPFRNFRELMKHHVYTTQYQATAAPIAQSAKAAATQASSHPTSPEPLSVSSRRELTVSEPPSWYLATSCGARLRMSFLPWRVTAKQVVSCTQYPD